MKDNTTLYNEVEFLVTHNSKLDEYTDKISEFIEGSKSIFFYPVSLRDIILTIINSYQGVKNAYTLSNIIVEKILDDHFGILVLSLDDANKFRNRSLIPAFDDIQGDWLMFIYMYYKDMPDDVLLRTFKNIEKMMYFDIIHNKCKPEYLKYEIK